MCASIHAWNPTHDILVLNIYFGPLFGPCATPRHEILVHRRATIWLSSAAWGPRQRLCIDIIQLLSKLISRPTHI